MKSIYDRTFVILNFVAVNRWEKGKEQILEVAAVKVRNGEICEHFSTFVAPQQPSELKFECEDSDYCGITPFHLIGAPSLEEVCKRVHAFTEGCDLAVPAISNRRYIDLFLIFREAAAKFGINFEDPVVSIYNLCWVDAVMSELRGDELDLSASKAFEIAAVISCDFDWEDALANYEIWDLYAFFDFEYVRKDCLAWALAFARLFIKIIYAEDGKEIQDEKYDD